MNIAIMPGDGIGQEIMKQGIKAIRVLGAKYHLEHNLIEVPIGGIAYERTGVPLPLSTIEVCKTSDAVLLGAVGGPKYDCLPSDLRPEKGLLGIRKALEVFANLRPAILFPQLKEASPLKSAILGDGINIMIVRELIGGAYFGAKGQETSSAGRRAWDTIEYTTPEIDRILRIGFETARKRDGHLTMVDKANVLESSKLWRVLAEKMHKKYADIRLDFMYVDNAAMQLIHNPQQFDTIVTENMFGDILSDEASMVTGSLGLLPSASLGSGTNGIYEPIHGSAPDIAGQDKANPIGMIMSIAMMYRYSFNNEPAAQAIEQAVSLALSENFRTPDIYCTGMTLVGTEEMGTVIADRIM